MQYGAAWHYRCSLVPKNSIIQYYRNFGWEVPLNDDYIGCTVNYFEIEISKQFTDKIKLCFAQYYPFIEIWDGGVSFENFTDSKIEIFPDDIECKLNLLNIDLQFIDILFDVAHRNDCLFVSSTETEKFFAATRESLLHEMAHSPKHIFLSKWKKASGL